VIKTCPDVLHPPRLERTREERLDANDDHDLFVLPYTFLPYTFLPRINSELNQFASAWKYASIIHRRRIITITVMV